MSGTNAPFAFKVAGQDVTDYAAVQAHITTLESRPAPPAPATFKIAGQDTTDVAAVQTHITALETAAEEGVKQGRKEYVAQLAKDNKMLAPQVEGYQALVETMSDSQFADFKKLYDASAPLALLGKHADGVSNEDGKNDTTTPAEREIKTLESIVKNFERGGKDSKWIEGTKAYKRLQVLQGTAK